jgi:hypothetical protein
MDVSKGSIDIASAQILDSGNITAKKSITIGSEEVTSINYLCNLTVSNSVGGISLYGKMTGNASVTAKHSDIDAYLSGSSNNYTLTGDSQRISVSAGSGEASEDTSLYATIDFEPKSGTANVTYE